MFLTILLHKLKSLLLVIVHAFSRALCCFRRRRPSDQTCLTDVEIVGSEDSRHRGVEWGEWEEENQAPRTVQDHINFYRRQLTQPQSRHSQSSGNEDEAQLEFFQDMAPTITAQTRHLIKMQGRNEGSTSFTDDSLTMLGVRDLEEWEETSGWERETLDEDALQALREKKKEDRKKRLNQKRLQEGPPKGMTRTLGARVSA